MKCWIAGALLLFGPIAGCQGGEAAVLKRQTVDSSAGSVALGLGNERAYRPVTLSANGSVGGIVLLQGLLANGSIPTGRDSAACTDDVIARQASTNAESVTPIAGVLVWVDGIASGKPLPNVRRATLTIAHCRFVPPLIAVTTGTTVNVMSQDRTPHTSQFYREKSSAVVDQIQTVDAGQVVPSERIAKQAGIVEARHAQHPWVRGYVAVFDHPYFAVTDDRGAFRIDSLPPGTYTIKVWHQRLNAPGEHRVVIAPGGVGRLELMLTAK